MFIFEKTLLAFMVGTVAEWLRRSPATFVQRILSGARVRISPVSNHKFFFLRFLSIYPIQLQCIL